jgi:hypothetical protein
MLNAMRLGVLDPRAQSLLQLLTQRKLYDDAIEATMLYVVVSP